MSAVELELRVAWQQHIGTSAAACEWFDAVLGRHREPARQYHDVRHVGWVVRHVLAIAERSSIDDLAATVAAAFFHDAVYDPQRSDNEAASATLAQHALGELDWSPARARRVAELVRATEGHDVEHADRDTCVLLAADLAVLAAEPARYADYATAVRREYAHVDDAAWRSGRSAVLRSLLARPHLFAPDLELGDWEARARANIAAELASLSDGGSSESRAGP
jgi:predicted metal-dependent HD superfamily phosphohydrolase